jgi:membrane-associated phospholipid phosphatase
LALAQDAPAFLPAQQGGVLAAAFSTLLPSAVCKPSVLPAQAFASPLPLQQSLAAFPLQHAALAFLSSSFAALAFLSSIFTTGVAYFTLAVFCAEVLNTKKLQNANTNNTCFIFFVFFYVIVKLIE